MEEKKTKKMTKAEAFEWLKCRKIDACGYLSEVQEKLFSLGITWITGDTVVVRHGIYLFINEYGALTHGGCDEVYWKRHCYKEIKVEDILSIEIVEEKSEEEDALDLISTVGARLSEVLRRMKGHKHIVITEDDVILYDEGMSLFHSDPF